MDVLGMIDQFREQKAAVERAIETLQELQRDSTAGQKGYNELSGKKRGRKFMPTEERALVSLRMRRYWAQRKGEAPRV